MNEPQKSIEQFTQRFRGPYQLFVWNKEFAGTWNEAQQARVVYSHGFPFRGLSALFQAMAVIERAQSSLGLPPLGVVILDPLFNRLELVLIRKDKPS